jgi:hypothetical protein
MSEEKMLILDYLDMVQLSQVNLDLFIHSKHTVHEIKQKCPREPKALANMSSNAKLGLYRCNLCIEVKQNQEKHKLHGHSSSSIALQVAQMNPLSHKSETSFVYLIQ